MEAVDSDLWQCYQHVQSYPGPQQVEGWEGWQKWGWWMGDRDQGGSFWIDLSKSGGKHGAPISLL